MFRLVLDISMLGVTEHHQLVGRIVQVDLQLKHIMIIAMVLIGILILVMVLKLKELTTVFFPYKKLTRV